MSIDIRHEGQWLFVPVIDDEDGTVICWDVHRDEQDWSSGEPFATGRTLTDARRALREHMAHVRMMRQFGVTA